MHAFHFYSMFHLNNIKSVFACMQYTIVTPSDEHTSDNPESGRVQAY